MGFNIESYLPDQLKNNIILFYKGNVDSDVINHILDTVEDKMIQVNDQSRLRKKVYNVLVESLQNLYHHVDVPLNNGKSDDCKSNFGIFILSKLDDAFRISTGNFIHHDRIPVIKGKIDKINSLSEEELKEFYKFVLNNQKFSEKGGGGLGLIDMARKSGNKLDYKFFKYSDDFEFFNLTVVINAPSNLN